MREAGVEVPKPKALVEDGAVLSEI